MLFAPKSCLKSASNLTASSFFSLMLVSMLAMGAVVAEAQAAEAQSTVSVEKPTTEKSAEEKPVAKDAVAKKTIANKSAVDTAASEKNVVKEAAPKKSNESKEAKEQEAKRVAAEKKAAEAKAAAKKKASEGRARRAKERAERKAAEEAKEEAKIARFALFKLDGELPESPGASGPFSDIKIDLRKLVARMDQAATDEKVKGVLIRIGSPTIGAGQRNEIREAIQRIRSAGKRVVAEMEVGSGGAYLIACACDEIIMPESGYLLIPGVRAEPLFYKGLLAKIGVEADFVHVGDAKGAAEPYTRESWSEPVKENITNMLDDMFDQMVDTIAMERPMSRQEVTKAIDRGLMTSTKAKKIGLIDRLSYAGDLKTHLAESMNVEKVTFIENYGQKKVDTDFSGPGGFFKLLGMMAGSGQEKKSRGQKIAIVYAVGPIMSGESETDMFGKSSSIGSTTLVKALGKAADDDQVAAIVLRVNSPGGSAVASDIIWSKIEQIDKPVIASMGDVAASGGYYISMGADAVFAEPTTVTGSIGVVGGKMAVKGMLSKLGVTSDLISRGKNSGLFSPYEKFSKSERKALVGMMEETYEQFTAKAAEGRGLSQDRVKELGGGRVYTGRQAKKLGLIDHLGDLKAAIAEAKRLAEIDEETKVRIQTYPEAVDFFESLFGGDNEQREVSAAIAHALSLGGAAPELFEATQRLAQLRQLFAREPVALIAPFELKISE